MFLVASHPRQAPGVAFALRECSLKPVACARVRYILGTINRGGWLLGCDPSPRSWGNALSIRQLLPCLQAAEKDMSEISRAEQTSAEIAENGASSSRQRPELFHTHKACLPEPPTWSYLQRPLLTDFQTLARSQSLIPWQALPSDTTSRYGCLELLLRSLLRPQSLC